ncbi:hypothetical protein QYE76_008572 [Lolium multiflorum]|uniref:Jacalin-type lectin domain-containing protein n=1 Tax=Lolium multiflorum TaxID=4521 RepID=A0AAD8TTK9_LOLMU|nr:hypothetical protein QYE76_008572 [Lolium multiflorum]
MAVVVSVGPWGAPGGEPRDIPIGSMPQSLVSITIWSIKALGGPICGFSYVYVDQNGGPIHVGPWGNADPEHTITNIQMGPGEYLYELSGTADDSALLSLKLVTNQHTYEVGAPLEQTTFSMPLKNGKVVAFFGRSDNDHLTALGIYVPVMKGSPVNVGPWGDSGGIPVDITTPVQLKSVTVYSTDSSDGRIYGFSFTYVDLTGQSIHVGPWGTIKGEKHTFDLSLQGEYVNKITGTTAGDNRVTSLKFTTNQERDYGPFGSDRGNAFSVPLPDGEHNGAVVGFFGRSGKSHVDLGVYVGLAPNEP